jgi:hypothetical protein
MSSCKSPSQRAVALQKQVKQHPQPPLIYLPNLSHNKPHHHTHLSLNQITSVLLQTSPNTTKQCLARNHPLITLRRGPCAQPPAPLPRHGQAEDLGRLVCGEVRPLQVPKLLSVERVVSLEIESKYALDSFNVPGSDSVA